MHAGPAAAAPAAVVAKLANEQALRGGIQAGSSIIIRPQYPLIHTKQQRRGRSNRMPPTTSNAWLYKYTSVQGGEVM